MSWFGLVDDSMDVDTFLEDFNTILNLLKGSFSPKTFPRDTFIRVEELLSHKRKNFPKIAFSNDATRIDLQDFLVDMEKTLSDFYTSLKAGKLAITAQRKDFVGARNPMTDELRRIGASMINSRLAQLRSFQQTLRLLGV